jgi:hypothetical protein
MIMPAPIAQDTKAKWPWRPCYWEPVAGTGERIMVGVIHGYGNEFQATRTIRDDVLVSLFGKSATGLKRLIDHGLNIFQTVARADQSLNGLMMPISGLYPGDLRATEAASIADLLHTACLLYSSLGNLDKFDESEDTDAPQQEEVNHHFSSEVKEAVARMRPDLSGGFGRNGVLIPNGQPVKFGYFSPRAVLHFMVLHPVRTSQSVRDARARIFELNQARDIANIQTAALIAAVPRIDDATLGTRQREMLKATQAEIEREADFVKLRWHGVHTASQGASKVIELIG